jgi:hypothetical protein
MPDSPENKINSPVGEPETELTSIEFEINSIT